MAYCLTVGLYTLVQHWHHVGLLYCMCACMLLLAPAVWITLLSPCCRPNKLKANIVSLIFLRYECVFTLDTIVPDHIYLGYDCQIWLLQDDGNFGQSYPRKYQTCTIVSKANQRFSLIFLRYECFHLGYDCIRSHLPWIRLSNMGITRWWQFRSIVSKEIAPPTQSYPR
jgi:hypothetical protein